MKSFSVSFHKRDRIKEEDIKFVVMVAFHKGYLVVVRHRDRETWEVPGGHIESFESGDEAAKRELYEETGAIDFDLHCLGVYSVDRGEDSSYGLLYRAEVTELGPLPESEIVEVKLFNELPDNLTYPLIQPILYEKVANLS